MEVFHWTIEDFIELNISMIKKIDFFKNFFEGSLVPCFGLLVMSTLVFKARVYSLICAWQSHMCYMFPEADLWCNTCWTELFYSTSSLLPLPHRVRPGRHSTEWAMLLRLIRIKFRSDVRTACKRSAQSTYCSQTSRCLDYLQTSPPTLHSADSAISDRWFFH